MSEVMSVEESIARGLYTKAIGELVINCLETQNGQEIAALAERNACALLRRIKEILDDPALDDPTCFQRIDAIVSAWHEAGLETGRHWECE